MVSSLYFNLHNFVMPEVLIMSFSLRQRFSYHCLEKEKNVLYNLFVMADFVIVEVHCILTTVTHLSRSSLRCSSSRLSLCCSSWAVPSSRSLSTVERDISATCRSQRSFTSCTCSWSLEIKIRSTHYLNWQCVYKTVEWIVFITTAIDFQLQQKHATLKLIKFCLLHNSGKK